MRLPIPFTLVLSIVLFPAVAFAQGAASWHIMQDAVAFFTWNHQGGDRGGTDFGVQNWWMGMAERRAGAGKIRFNLMLSLDPASLGNDGYRHIFQIGETLDGFPLIDRQHPHDFLMQAAVIWERPLPRGYTLLLAGAPVGEPALGPVAFMHRSSAFENPSAPLAHHTFDSTHIAMGVITGGLRKDRWHAEGSIFHGREPDEQRWDLMDPGPLDSWSVRGWYRPNDEWTTQVSHGFLNEPESLEPGDLRRTTASASWLRRNGSRWSAATFAYGRNDKQGKTYHAALAEATLVFGRTTVYGRLEAVDVETDVLRFGTHSFVGGRKAHVADDLGRIDTVGALTLGGVRTFLRLANWDFGAGGDVTFYSVPGVLRPTHGDSPVSFHAFFRIRPPAPMGRMVDMVMTSGMMTR